jgi:hypothetical protein
MKQIRAAWIAGLMMVMLGLAASLVVVGPVQAQDFGTNWTGTFYPTNNLSGTGVPVSGINGLNFNWGTGAPIINGVAVPGMPVDNFSARFTSLQNFVAGTYNFSVRSDDGIRILIDGVPIIDQFFGRLADPPITVLRDLGGPHNLVVEYFEGLDQAVLQFSWTLVNASVGTGTPAFGTPVPVVTAVPALQIEVSGVRGLSIRTGPYLGASLVGVLRPGTKYTPLARNRDEGPFTWWLVNDGTRTGWVSGRYITVTGNPETAPLQSSVFEQIDGAADIGVIGVTRSVMNFRRRPSTRTQVLAKIPWGDEVSIIGRTIQGGRNHWLQVRWNGQVGWIAAPWVSIRGEIDAVPIR